VFVQQLRELPFAALDSSGVSKESMFLLQSRVPLSRFLIPNYFESLCYGFSMGWTASRFDKASMDHDSTLDHRNRKARKGPIMEVTTIEIGLAKSVFQLRSSDATGKAVLRMRLAQLSVVSFRRQPARLPVSE
jgi:hypothetical protein